MAVVGVAFLWYIIISSSSSNSLFEFCDFLASFVKATILHGSCFDYCM